MAQKGENNSGSVRSSAGCRYSAGTSLYSANTGTIEGPLPYRIIHEGLPLYHRRSETPDLHSSVIYHIGNPYVKYYRCEKK